MLCVKLVTFVIGIHIVLLWKPTATYSDESQDAYEKFLGKSSRFFWILNGHGCAGFFRGYLPSVEHRLMSVSNFSPSFMIENPTFSKKLLMLQNSKNEVLQLYLALKETGGIKVADRRICSLAFMTSDEYNGAIPNDILNPSNNSSVSLDQCEKWIYFLYAVKTSTDSRNEELQMWSAVIRHFESFNQNYLLLAQKIIHGMYGDHQFKYESRFNIFGEPYSLTNELRKSVHSRMQDFSKCLFDKEVDKPMTTNAMSDMGDTSSSWMIPAFQKIIEGKPPLSSTITINTKKLWNAVSQYLFSTTRRGWRKRNQNETEKCKKPGKKGQKQTSKRKS